MCFPRYFDMRRSFLLNIALIAFTLAGIGCTPAAKTTKPENSQQSQTSGNQQAANQDLLAPAEKLAKRVVLYKLGMQEEGLEIRRQKAIDDKKKTASEGSWGYIGTTEDGKKIVQQHSKSGAVRLKDMPGDEAIQAKPKASKGDDAIDKLAAMAGIKPTAKPAAKDSTKSSTPPTGYTDSGKTSGGKKVYISPDKKTAWVEK